MKKVVLLTLLLVYFLGINAQQYLRGYNIAHVFDPFPNQKINAEGMQLFDRLSPDVLRFPGGSIANKYHFYKPGYGWSNTDMQKKENYIVEFVKLVKALKTEPKVIFVYNLFDHFKGADEESLIKENFDALQYLINNGINVIAVELGNEFYLYNEVIGLPGFTSNPEDNNIEQVGTGDAESPTHSTTNQNPPPKKDNFLIHWLKILTGQPTKKNFVNSNITASVSNKDISENTRLEKYGRLAKIYHDKTKKINPKIKTGAPLGSFKNPKHKEYNEYVLANFSYVDAFVVHFYGSFKESCKEGDLVCVKEGLDWTIKATIEPVLKYLKDETNKEIWVTEWNSVKFGHWGDEASWVRNTNVHVEYVKKFLDVFDKYGVTISNFHKLFGPMDDSAYNAVDVDKSGKCHTTPVYDQLIKYY